MCVSQHACPPVLYPRCVRRRIIEKAVGIWACVCHVCITTCLSTCLVPQVREVEVQREGSGGLGLCVKGGAEHRLPVLISRIIKNQAADRCKQLLVGDAILRVSGPGVRVAQTPS